MNKRQVITLWAVAAALGAGVTAVKLSQSESGRNVTQRIAGQTLIASFPGADAATLEIKGATSSTKLTKKDGIWVVVERDNYPANSAEINGFIRALSELKVTTAMEAGPSFAPRFGMDEKATAPDDHGLTATFKDASGKEIAKVTLGKNIESNAQPTSFMGGSNAAGRYIRNHADETGFYGISELFPSIYPEPKRWLAAGFINPQKVKSISTTLPDKPENAWKVARESEEANYKLENAATHEVLNNNVGLALNSLLSAANYEDIIPAGKLAERTGEGKRTAIIETFEGFTYTLQIAPLKPEKQLGPVATPASEPAATDNYLLTVNVAAELPKERKKPADEKPEDAKAADEAFTNRLKQLTGQLESEKKLNGFTFEVSKSIVSALLNDRAALTAKAEPPQAGAPAPGGAQMLPGGVIATPPVGFDRNDLVKDPADEE